MKRFLRLYAYRREDVDMDKKKKKKVGSEEVREVAILCIILKMQLTVLESGRDGLYAIKDDAKSK